MDYGITRDTVAQQRTGCAVVGVHAGGRLSPSAAMLDAVGGQAIAQVLARGDLGDEPGSTLLLRGLAGVTCERVLLVALGPEGGLTEGSYRKALAAAVQALGRTGAAHATFCLHEAAVGRRDLAWRIEQAVLAVADGLYRFDRLKSPAARHRPRLQNVDFQLAAGTEAGDAQDMVRRAAAVAEGIALAKDLGNMPGNLCTPTYLAQRAAELAQQHGLRVEVLEQHDVERLGMGAFLAVARGSPQPCKLIVLEHRAAAADAPPVVLVGKGITFDAGGISIKPAPAMDEMKFDMCGAASVFGAVHAAALLQLPLNVIALIPATENMPGGNAIKPGNVVTTLSGRTVEILDTDCEGRLVLCDALTYAERFRPAAVVDVATLTGEIVTALGEVATGLFANDDALAREILAAGDAAWDRAWQMPLWEEYQEALQSNFADLPNIGIGTDCSVTAACFLSRFTQAYPWAHLDIAGTASRSGADKGATGRPVALLVEWLAGRARGGR
jgi:leucyl aminopeptidase